MSGLEETIAKSTKARIHTYRDRVSLRPISPKCEGKKEQRWSERGLRSPRSQLRPPPPRFLGTLSNLSTTCQPLSGEEQSHKIPCVRCILEDAGRAPETSTDMPPNDTCPHSFLPTRLPAAGSPPPSSPPLPLPGDLCDTGGQQFHDRSKRDARKPLPPLPNRCACLSIPASLLYVPP